jgi:transposase
MVGPAFARTTDALRRAHYDLGLALGGEAGARLADRLAMPTSPDTILRRVKQFPRKPPLPPRVVGIDDWAWRKGQRYGTILIDQERRKVLDLLPDRTSETLQTWLKGHPQIEVITRDRSSTYSQAASSAAPQARQIADRWHLLKNLREAVERIFGRLSTLVRTALTEPAPTTAATDVSDQTPAPEPSTAERNSGSVDPNSQSEEPTPLLQRQSRDEKRHQRVLRHQRVRSLRGQGFSMRQIARETGLSLQVVRRYCRTDRCPDWNPGRRGASQLDAYAAEIVRWVNAGGRNTAELYRELKGRGCPVSYDAVRRFASRQLGNAGRPGPRTGPVVAPPSSPPSARKLSFGFIKREEKRDEDERAWLEKLRTQEPIRVGLDLAGEFAEMVRQRSPCSLPDWLAKAKVSTCPELGSFADGLRLDKDAVAAALTEKWSNGRVEGNVNRLKLIKRQMYGRAGFELLRARVLNAA